MPVNGSVNLSISPGVILLAITEANGDKSPYKQVNSEGVSVSAPLFLTAGAPAAIRIDLIECAYLPDQVIEQTGRDVYNNTTKAFVSQTVTKVMGDKLQFRIRTGSNGGGMPALAQGWLPLAVVMVPAGALTWDSCVLWDVRPLLADRPINLMNLENEIPAFGSKHYIHVEGLADTTSGQQRMNGYVDVTYKGRYRGGYIYNTLTGASTTYVDLESSTNQATDYTTAAGYKYVYLVQPFGLPRWIRYADASAGVRTPRGPRGLIVISNNPCDSFGRNTGTLTLPLATGLVTACAVGTAVCIQTLVRADFESVGVQTSAAYTTGKKTFVGKNSSIQAVLQGHKLAGVTINTTQTVSDQFASGTLFTASLTGGTDYPANAKSVAFSFVYEYDPAAVSDTYEQMWLTSRSSMRVHSTNLNTFPMFTTMRSSPPGFEVPTVNLYPHSETSTCNFGMDFLFKFSNASVTGFTGWAGGGAVALNGLYVVGWEI
jgi:hypothetical protein